MQIARIRGATRIIGRAQGYAGLPLRDEDTTLSSGNTVPSMVSAWFPTPEELAKLNAGAPVTVKLLGSAHPPIMVGVGEPPDEDPADVAPPAA